VADDEGDDLPDTDRAALHAALARSWESMNAGHVRPSSQIIDELRTRR
jgi:hypothetical protein